MRRSIDVLHAEDLAWLAQMVAEAAIADANRG